MHALSLPFPAKVLFIRTTGSEEGSAAYTSANAIVLPQVELGAPVKNLQFLVIERSDSSLTVNPIYDGQNAKLVDPDKVSGFFEQVGKNTQYLIHSEEILADNFTKLVLRPSDVPSPDIIERLRG